MSEKIAKYRIAISEKEVDKMLELIAEARIEASLDTILLSLLSVLSQTKAKILTSIKPAYVMITKESLEESLGMPAPIPGVSFNSVATIPKDMPKETYWLECYRKWIDTPNTCTLQELKAVKEHMYLSNLMTPEQEAEFELL